MKYLYRTFIPFLAGVIVIMNLVRLVPTNPGYDAQWWKVVIALVFGLIISPLFAREREK